MNKFCFNLKTLMKENRTTQLQLATALNVKQQAVSRYVSGEREPDIDTIIKIAQYFDVSTDYLLGLTDSF